MELLSEAGPRRVDAIRSASAGRRPRYPMTTAPEVSDFMEGGGHRENGAMGGLFVAVRVGESMRKENWLAAILAGGQSKASALGRTYAPCNQSLANRSPEWRIRAASTSGSAILPILFETRACGTRNRPRRLTCHG